MRLGFAMPLGLAAKAVSYHAHPKAPIFRIESFDAANNFS
jgi:hypothetical protein